MKKKRLLIGIPTKEHPKYIQYYLSSALQDAKKYNIDIGIYDSSSTDETKKIVEKKQGGGIRTCSIKNIQRTHYIGKS